nr:uncharacterized protein LOC124814863 [Hydra vulgaris]
MELAKSDGIVAEQIASSTIVSKESSPCGTIRLVQPKGGGLLPITQGPSCSKQLFKDPAVVTAKDLAQVQLNTGLSNSGIKKLTSTIMHVSSAKVLEPNILHKFQDLGKSLEEHFTQTPTTFISSDQKKSQSVVIHCKNLQALTEEVLLSRKVFSKHIIKLGINGGGGFLKVCLGVLQNEADSEAVYPPNKRFLTSSTSKDSGVKQQFLVAVAEGVQENYSNVKLILSLISISEINFVVSCDMKLANIICGLQSHASAHPCTWCTVESSNLANQGTLRTFRSLKQAHKTYTAAGSDIKKAKLFGNVIHDPILSLDDDALVLDLIPPMELHLLLGVGNYLFKILTDLWPKSAE